MPYDGLKQKLTTGAAAGELPDLIRTDLGWNAQFAKLGVLKQLDGNMPNYDALAANHNQPKSIHKKRGGTQANQSFTQGPAKHKRAKLI